MRSAHALGILGLVTGCTPLSENEKIVEQAKIRVGNLLKDPSSAQYRDVASKGNVVCGLFNSKNGFGAYTGFEGFIVDGDNVTLGDQSAEFYTAFNKNCPLDTVISFGQIDTARTSHRTNEIIKALGTKNAQN